MVTVSGWPCRSMARPKIHCAVTVSRFARCRMSMASLVLSSARYTYYPRPRTRLQVSSMRQFLFTGRLCWRLIWFSTGSNFRAHAQSSGPPRRGARPSFPRDSYACGRATHQRTQVSIIFKTFSTFAFTTAAHGYGVRRRTISPAAYCDGTCPTFTSRGDWQLMRSVQCASGASLNLCWK